MFRLLGVPLYEMALEVWSYSMALRQFELRLSVTNDGGGIFGECNKDFFSSGYTIINKMYILVSMRASIRIVYRSPVMAPSRSGTPKPEIRYRDREQ